MERRYDIQSQRVMIVALHAVALHGLTARAKNRRIEDPKIGGSHRGLAWRRPWPAPGEPASFTRQLPRLLISLLLCDLERKAAPGAKPQRLSGTVLLRIFDSSMLDPTVSACACQRTAVERSLIFPVVSI